MMATMDEELIAFLKARLDTDEHNVVALQSVAPPDVDVLLESTVPMLDGVRAVVDLYAVAAHSQAPNGAEGSDAFSIGQAAGLEAAVRKFAAIYHDDPAFRAQWYSGPVALDQTSETADRPDMA